MDTVLFKSTLSKYLTAFIIIILVSFIAVSSIITSTIRAYATNKNAETLKSTSESIADHLSENQYGNLETHIVSERIPAMIIPIISLHDRMEIMIVDDSGKVLLRALPAQEGKDSRQIFDFRDKDLGYIDVTLICPSPDSEEHSFEYKGKLEEVSGENIQLCSTPVVVEGDVRGYIVSFMSTEKEDVLVAASRRATINSCLWVMLAAVIAVYFITERIVRPLRTMTGAAKKFAKGDFSSRVTVYGHDEVSELAEAFNNMAESLDNFENMRNSFLANVSHDLRTPMTTISGFIDGITSGAIPPEKHAYYLGVISDEVHRLSRLVTELLDISRLESGERKFNFENFDVAEMARVILISFEQKIEEKKLDVIFESESDEMLVVADKDAIHQVLYNLCHNAVKFSRVGGKLAISLTRTENQKIRISVYDEGQSINLEDLDLVFDRFYKTDKSRGVDKSGVGLGLYICKTIIDAHSEEIHAESPNDNGCEFWFTLKDADSQGKKSK